MKKLLLAFSLVMALVASTHAQVKIGDNPNTINANSLLEMESSNKGFLPPRVAINSVNSVAPLTATTPAGMLVYSSGGTVADGYYTWSGTKWLALSTHTYVRDSMVMVKTAADFPAASGGVINLVPGTLYEINGVITMTDRINLNGCTIRGGDRTNDKLIYTATSGELFTGAVGGNINNLIISAIGTGSQLFNIDGGGIDPTKNLIMDNVFMLDSKDLGVIKGFPGFVVMSNMAFSGNLNGITFENIGDFIGVNEFWLPDNQNTFEKFVGTFNTIQKDGGHMTPLSVFSAVGIDVSGVTSISTGGSMQGNVFSGDGTYVVGTFSNQWEINSYGIDTETDDVASGNVYITTTATTTPAAINTPTKILGTTTSASLFRVTAPVSNRLTYIGGKTRTFTVSCALTTSYVGSGSNKYFTFYIAKNGVVLPESKQGIKLSTNTDQTSVALSCAAVLGPNDYVEVWLENNSDATGMIVKNMNLSIK